MTFEDYDALCAMAAQANSKASLRVFTMFPMEITFLWKWPTKECRDVSCNFSYCFHIGEIEAMGFDQYNQEALGFVFAACQRDMERAL